MNALPAITAASTVFRLYAPDPLPEDAPLLLAFADAAEAGALAALLAGETLVLAVPEVADWEHTFSPWPAPRVFKKAPGFGGGAPAFFDKLAAALPQIEGSLKLCPRWRGAAGYSLGGLFAAWCAYRDGNPFARIAAVSASLWFDGWTDFAAAQAMPQPPQYADFSLGDTEKNSRNPRMAAVESATLATVENWRTRGIATGFGFNPGGHFDHAPERTAAAARRLLAAA